MPSVDGARLSPRSPKNRRGFRRSSDDSSTRFATGIRIPLPFQNGIPAAPLHPAQCTARAHWLREDALRRLLQTDCQYEHPQCIRFPRAPQRMPPPRFHRGARPEWRRARARRRTRLSGHFTRAGAHLTVPSQLRPHPFSQPILVRQFVGCAAPLGTPPRLCRPERDRMGGL